MREPKACIYVLFFPEGVYIGRTKNLKYRLQEHDHPPNWGVLETTLNRMETCKAEIKWMEVFQGLGVTLLNKIKGSNGAYDIPQDVRDKISAANKGRKMSLETRQKMSAWQKGVPKHYRTNLVGMRKGWEILRNLTKEQRSEMRKRGMTDASREGLRKGWEYWANLTPEQVSEIRKRTQRTRRLRISSTINCSRRNAQFRAQFVLKHILVRSAYLKGISTNEIARIFKMCQARVYQIIWERQKIEADRQAASIANAIECAEVV